MAKSRVIGPRTDTPGSKADVKKRSSVKKKSRKYGRNKVKCANYRIRVGKPNGPGVPGNKAGKNKG